MDGFGGEIEVLQYLIPHPRPWLPEVIKLRRGIQRDRDIQLSQNRRNLTLPGIQTTPNSRRGFALGVQRDGALVADDDDVESGCLSVTAVLGVWGDVYSCSWCSLFSRTGTLGCHHFQSPAS